MQCHFCHAWNEEDSPRCARCGRRAAPDAGKGPFPYMTALAESWDHNVQVDNDKTAQAKQQKAAPPDATRPAQTEKQQSDQPQPDQPQPDQPWLFRANDITGRPKVVPIPILTPRADPFLPKSRKRAGAHHASSHRSANTAGRQHSFEFQSVEADSAPSLLDAVIDCDAPVATTQLRVTAAAVDAGWVAGALAMFLAIFWLWGGSLSFDNQTFLLVGGSAVVLSLLYRTLWCLGGGDTPGTRSTGLMLINFDGRRPDRTQRLTRMAAGVLSVLSAGLGLVWVLVDEEHLAWHDHISRDFPDPSR